MKTSEKFEELTPEDNLLYVFSKGNLRLFSESSGLLEVVNLGNSPSGDYLVAATKADPPLLHWLDAKTWVAPHSNNRLVKVKRERFVVISGHIPPGRDTLELLADTQVYGVQRVTTHLEQAEGWKTDALLIKKAWFSRIINLDDPTWVDTYTPIVPE
jgi:hypothetical protein